MKQFIVFAALFLISGKISTFANTSSVIQTFHEKGFDPFSKPFFRLIHCYVHGLFVVITGAWVVVLHRYPPRDPAGPMKDESGIIFICNLQLALKGSICSNLSFRYEFSSFKSDITRRKFH